MGKEILEHRLDQVEIKQTRTPTQPIRFKDEVINKVRKENYVFGKKSNKFIPFIVSKDSHQKGLKLKILKGSPGDNNTVKTFYLVYWFNGKGLRHLVGNYSQSFTKPTLYLIRRQDEFIGNTPQEIVAKVQYRPIHIAKRYN